MGTTLALTATLDLSDKVKRVVGSTRTTIRRASSAATGSPT
jgi:hypothetical protein